MSQPFLLSRFNLQSSIEHSFLIHASNYKHRSCLSRVLGYLSIHLLSFCDLVSSYIEETLSTVRIEMKFRVALLFRKARRFLLQLNEIWFHGDQWDAIGFMKWNSYAFLTIFMLCNNLGKRNLYLDHVIRIARLQPSKCTSFLQYANAVYLDWCGYLS